MTKIDAYRTCCYGDGESCCSKVDALQAKLDRAVEAMKQAMLEILEHDDECEAYGVLHSVLAELEATDGA